MISFAHIINPFAAARGSDLEIAMPITFESMRIAKKQAEGKVNVDLLSVQFSEDHAVVPDGFFVCPDLQRSVLDFGNFTHPVRLPLISDILELAMRNSSSEYIIYTNIDIGLQPHFYLEVARRIEEGKDACIINRRRISKHFNQVQQLPEMWKEKGKPHPGF